MLKYFNKYVCVFVCVCAIELAIAGIFVFFLLSLHAEMIGFDVLAIMVNNLRFQINESNMKYVCAQHFRDYFDFTMNFVPTQKRYDNEISLCTNIKLLIISLRRWNKKEI